MFKALKALNLEDFGALKQSNPTLVEWLEEQQISKYQKGWDLQILRYF